MNFHYLTYAGVIHRVDFELSTDTPYDMAKCWQGRSTSWKIVRDNKRLPDARPDIITWDRAGAAIVSHSLPPAEQAYVAIWGESDVQLAIKTQDGICALYRHDNRWGLAHVANQYVYLPDNKLRDIQHTPNGNSSDITTDLYTDELVYISGVNVIKKNVARYCIGMITDGGIASVGNVAYMIGNGRINMYDDRLGEMQGPITIYESNDIRIARCRRMRMMSDAIIAVGSVHAMNDMAYSHMVLFDVRSPGRFAAEPPPVILTSTDGVKQIEL